MQLTKLSVEQGHIAESIRAHDLSICMSLHLATCQLQANRTQSLKGQVSLSPDCHQPGLTLIFEVHIAELSDGAIGRVCANHPAGSQVQALAGLAVGDLDIDSVFVLLYTCHICASRKLSACWHSAFEDHPAHRAKIEGCHRLSLGSNLPWIPPEVAGGSLE